MKFLCQGFQKLEHEYDYRQADVTECITSYILICYNNWKQAMVMVPDKAWLNEVSVV